jgi:hypothetical protein
VTEDKNTQDRVPLAAPAPTAQDRNETRSLNDSERSEFAHGLKPASHAQFMGMLYWNSSMRKNQQ